MLFIKQKMCHVAILNIAYIIRDGPLEKLWGAGGREILEPQKFFFSSSNFLCEFFLVHNMNIF